jgi:C4-dicarboxylate-specific signal transduction histidine kinase
VFTPGYFVDGAGEISPPRASAERIAQASAVPVYGVFETQIGAGIVGGYMSLYEDEAKQAGAMIVSLLNGVAPAKLETTVARRSAMVDWRQIQRWDVDEHRLSDDSVVRFREPTTLEKYRVQVSVAMTVLLLQGATIVWLLMERRRRRMAEAESQKRFSEVAHMNRRVAMGGLTASIAHELNQPLGAIHNNAGAAQLLLKTQPSRLDEVEEILEDIKHDDKRASEILARIRRMLRKTDLEVGALDLSDAMRETQKLLAYDAQAHGVSVKLEPERGLPKVWADSVQVQQVLLNLALNSMEAMQGQPAETRHLTIRSRLSNAREAEVSVIDSGTGIPAQILPQVFDPFVTSKVGGMGLGLSISRTIVEAFGGRMRAESMPKGGAAVHFTLPFQPGRQP